MALLAGPVHTDLTVVVRADLGPHRWPQLEPCGREPITREFGTAGLADGKGNNCPSPVGPEACLSRGSSPDDLPSGRCKPGTALFCKVCSYNFTASSA